KNRFGFGKTHRKGECRCTTGRMGNATRKRKRRSLVLERKSYRSSDRTEARIFPHGGHRWIDHDADDGGVVPFGQLCKVAQAGVLVSHCGFGRSHAVGAVV